MPVWLASFLAPILSRLMPYKTLIIVGSFVLYTVLAFGAGWHYKGKYDAAKVNADALEVNQEFIKEAAKLEEEYENGLYLDLEAIEQDGHDGDVAPVLRNALERLRR